MFSLCLPSMENHHFEVVSMGGRNKRVACSTESLTRQFETSTDALCNYCHDALSSFSR